MNFFTVESSFPSVQKKKDKENCFLKICYPLCHLLVIPFIFMLDLRFCPVQREKMFLATTCLRILQTLKPFLSCHRNDKASQFAADGKRQILSTEIQLAALFPKELGVSGLCDNVWWWGLQG